MKEHFCPAEQSTITYQGECNWCGEREALAQTQEQEPVNEYGVPLSACNGYRHDEHYWAFIHHKIMVGVGPYYEWLRSMMKENHD